MVLYILLALLLITIGYLALKTKHYGYIFKLLSREDVSLPELEKLRKSRIEAYKLETSEDTFTIADKEIRIRSKAEISKYTTISQNITAIGSLNIGSNCHIIGDISARGSVTIGESSIVEGEVISKKDILILQNVVVRGMLEARGKIVLNENSQVGAALAGGILNSKKMQA